MSDVLEATPAADLRVFVVWEPILQDDKRDAAHNNALIFDDERITHMWDGSATEAKSWSRKLGLPDGKLAWDVYILLPRGESWIGDALPTPAYWSHNLDLDVGRKYDLKALQQAVRDALGGAAKADEKRAAASERKAR